MIGLSLRLHIPVKELLNRLDAEEIADYMAYDLVTNPQWMEQQKKREELEASRSMSDEERNNAFLRAMGKT